MRRRSWDCSLPVFERHSSPGDETVERGQEGTGEGRLECVECVHAVIEGKTDTNCTCKVAEHEIGSSDVELYDRSCF